VGVEQYKCLGEMIENPRTLTQPKTLRNLFDPTFLIFCNRNGGKDSKQYEPTRGDDLCKCTMSQVMTRKSNKQLYQILEEELVCVNVNHFEKIAKGFIR
jgi:hypothetical protein